MPDEQVTGTGGSLILQCCDGEREFRKTDGAKGHEYHHPSNGSMTSIEVFDGSGGHSTVDIIDPKKARIVIHYEVP